MCPPARSCSCHPVLLMLLTQTASSPQNFILIGAGLVWQTLPAGWVHTFESHYTFTAAWIHDRQTIVTPIVYPKQLRVLQKLYE